MMLNSIKDMREKKWNDVRDNYLGQEIDITYIDEYPWTFNYPEGVAKLNVLCMGTAADNVRAYLLYSVHGM